MTFWTFLDRNGFGLAIFAIIVLCFATGECGNKQGCRLRCSTSEGVRIENATTSDDAGAR